MHNQYGYNIKDADDKIYHHIPSLSSPLKIKQVKDPLTAADTVKFNLGFELESSAQPGEYHRNLIFTLLAEDQASAQLVNGIEINKAIKKAVGITDARYLDNPLATAPRLSPCQIPTPKYISVVIVTAGMSYVSGVMLQN